jgi:thiamine biosynthesis lipoprotein
MADQSKTTRRDFLKGTSAVEAVGDALAAPPSPLRPPTSVGVEPGSHLLSVSREAMACLFEVVFDAATYRRGTDAAVAALDLVAALEDQLTIYRDTSEVAHINRHAAQEAVQVEPGLFGLLTRAVALFHETGGAFDITAGRLSKIWGFYRRQGRMPSPREVAEALATVGSQHLRLDASKSNVQFLIPGLELNLGAIGKGYAIDRAADALISGGIHNFLIHGGNSSVLARGCRSQSAIRNPQSAIETGWSVALRHPLKPEIRLAEFVLHDQALGTSGSGTQFFHYEGKRYGHILDPRTGWPADKVLSATVIAPTAEQADALSTALYVMGLDAARSFCEHHQEAWALLVVHGARAGMVELHPLNLPGDRWRRIAE